MDGVLDQPTTLVLCLAPIGAKSSGTHFSLRTAPPRKKGKYVFTPRTVTLNQAIVAPPRRRMRTNLREQSLVYPNDKWRELPCDAYVTTPFSRAIWFEILRYLFTQDGSALKFSVSILDYVMQQSRHARGSTNPSGWKSAESTPQQTLKVHHSRSMIMHNTHTISKTKRKGPQVRVQRVHRTWICCSEVTNCT